MDEGKLSGDNNVTVDAYKHTSNTQRDNTNAIFTDEKIDKSYVLEDMLNDLKINNSKY